MLTGGLALRNKTIAGIVCIVCGQRGQEINSLILISFKRQQKKI